MRRLKSPLQTLEKKQKRKQKHFLLTCKYSFYEPISIKLSKKQPWDKRTNTAAKGSLNLTQSTTPASNQLGLSFTPWAQAGLTHLCTPWGLGLYKTWQHHSFPSHRDQAWETRKREAVSDLGPLQPYLLASFNLSLPFHGSCAAHHSHPAQGLDTFADTWQVIEQLAASVLLPKGYHFLDLLGDGCQQIGKLILEKDARKDWA